MNRNRRRLLEGICATVPLVASGCLGSNGSTDRTEASESSSQTADRAGDDRVADDGVAEVSFERTACESRGDVATSVDGDVLRVDGCLEEFNGCRAAVLEAVRATSDGYVVRIGTEPVDPDAAPQQCPRSHILTGYRLTVRFAKQPATDVRIVHVDSRGRSRVATVQFE